jgi:hypothetical protein
MELGTWADWVSAIANVAIAITAGFAVYQGFKSLSTWRTETIGRRRIELAQEILTDFYQARDILHSVRHFIHFQHEAEDRPIEEDEDDKTRMFRDAAYIPIARLSDSAELFRRLTAASIPRNSSFREHRCKTFR